MPAQPHKQILEKAKTFAHQIVERCQQLISQHNQKVKALNTQIKKEDKIQRSARSRGDPLIQQQFYKYAEDTAQKLSIMLKKLSVAEKIKKERRDIYEHRISMVVGYIKDVCEQRELTIIAQQWLVKWTQEMGSISEQILKSLYTLQKQSKGFCFSGESGTDKSIEKRLIELVGYCQMWQMLSKCSPIIERQIQNQFIQIDYEQSVFNDVDKMIVGLWPQPEIIEVPVEKVVEKIVYEKPEQFDDSGSQSVSLKQGLEKRQLQQKNDRLNKELNFQKILREAHQTLIGLGRSQNVSKAIEMYLGVPEINQSQARQQVKTETELKINPLICNILGCLYQQGKYISRDLNKACEYFIKSASVEDPEGMYKIAKFLQKRLVNPTELFEQAYQNRSQQIKDAIEHYQKAAEKGHLDALTDLGHIYENGIKQDQIRGDHSVVSESEVSLSKVEDYIIEPNLEHAVKYYQLAKKDDFPRAFNNLGALLVRMGDKISQTMKGSNIQRGIKYLKRATELKYGKAFLNLGKCYEKGLGVKRNHEKAKSLYIEGAELEDNQCKLQFIKCLISNEITIQGKIDVKIHEYLRQILIAQPNNSEALYFMGVFQEKGIGVEKNSQAAYYYIHKAAKGDHSPSIVKLGDYYYSGYHVKKQVQKARLCYEKAASKGNSQGFINLGLLYQKGVIKTENKVGQKQLAMNYFLQAAKLGNPNAFLFLDSKSKIDSEKMKQAAELGSPDAIKILAKTNSTTEFENKSIEKGKAQYKNLINKYLRDANKFSQQVLKQQEKESKTLASPKFKQSILQSPRGKLPPQTQQPFSPRYLSPPIREGYRSQQYIRR